jgi:hypothetical protein
MTALREEALGEGDGARATERGKEAKTQKAKGRKGKE